MSVEFARERQTGQAATSFDGGRTASEAAGDGRVAILTYHRVLSRPAPDPRFHDVPWDEFEAQMRRVAQQRESMSSISEICITFDDGTVDHSRAGDLLRDLGLKGAFFVIAGWVGQDGYLSREQIRRLANQGHRIGSHCVSHTPLTRLSPADADAELLDSKCILEDLIGQPVDWMAPPGGIYAPDILERAMAQGYRVFRTMEWGYAQAPLRGAVPCWPVLPGRGEQVFENILAGRAGTWRYHLKNTFKKVLGEAVYSRWRDRLLTHFR